MMKHLLFGILCGLALCGCRSQTSFGDRAADAATLAAGNPVEETIRARRSIRRYEPQPVGRDTLLRILDCGLQAPNGQGRESWEVRVVTDSALLAALDRQYGCYVRQVSRNPKAQHPAAYGAPALVFIACDTTYDLSQVDCGLLGGNMILAAQSVGVGSCCLGGLCRFLTLRKERSCCAACNCPIRTGCCTPSPSAIRPRCPRQNPGTGRKSGSSNDLLYKHR